MKDKIRIKVVQSNRLTKYFTHQNCINSLDVLYHTEIQKCPDSIMMAEASSSVTNKAWQTGCVMNGEISIETIFVPGCQHVYFCCNKCAAIRATLTF